ncbi:hypothetical protein UFOVP1296_74 [uncultured Caudovirales phage]|uniref:Terminase n=1 Tax=uncultured Caudovirales phage TaxID=2100421 RepID=A0A6J5MCU0_9CAUD|nr:hypothetical protein UFOVP471_19 [uncultured Caudovirales phage]CAB4169647.1 hypothetical protein UFOVP890_74 [uncultured Caudovirales phage]CAB4196322.1 hypothetical protein UFOVP1296_74 [uncultured Caudovirales phage]
MSQLDTTSGSQQLMRYLNGATPADRRKFFAELNPEDRVAVANLLDLMGDNPWSRFRTDPVGFVVEGMGETIWSKQQEILESVRDNKRTAVPACHGLGKSHLAARAVCWWVASHPPQTTMVVTTATTFRQVRNILWREIRRVSSRHDFGGEVLTVEWKFQGTVTAFGFAPQAHDETAVQGIHAPNLLVVVDEAGGLSDTIGNALEGLMTGDHTRLLLLGNPPTDNEDSWFERACNSSNYNVIPVPVWVTPNFTGEKVGDCKSCPPHIAKHPLSDHLVDQTWVDDVITELGADSPFVEARVHARFPRITGNRVIPITWLEEASQNETPIESEQIRLGVDVASDGGDEFAIARADGYRVRLVHSASGAANQNAVDVAARILQEIHQAETDTVDMRRMPPKVKIDTIGVGWGVVSMLQRWFDEGRHHSIIIPVNVAERAGQADKFKNQRAEMWWNGREMVTPDKEGRIPMRIEADRKILNQLSLPSYHSDSSGRIIIESKVSMKKRGMNSPDRAEAILLAIYEPPFGQPAPVVSPIGLEQVNPWIDL